MAIIFLRVASNFAEDEDLNKHNLHVNFGDPFVIIFSIILFINSKTASEIFRACYKNFIFPF